VEPFGLELAATMAAKPERSLTLLKQHMARRLRPLVGALTTLTSVEPAGRSEPPSGAVAIAVNELPAAKFVRLTTAANDVLIATCAQQD
jgi:hypothetical protein